MHAETVNKIIKKIQLWNLKHYLIEVVICFHISYVHFIFCCCLFKLRPIKNKVVLFVLYLPTHLQPLSRVGNLGTTTKLCSFVPKPHPGQVVVVATPKI